MMKRTLIMVTLGTMFCLSANRALAQEKSRAVIVLDSLFKVQPPDTAKIQEQLQQLTHSSNERDWLQARNGYYRIGQEAINDSLEAAELLKFPLGYVARSNGSKEIFDEEDPQKAEKLYDAWLGKFPPEKFPAYNHERIVYDYVSSSVAQKYAKAGNDTRAKYLMGNLFEEFWKGNAYAGLAETFYKNGNLADAETYVKKAMESSRLFLNAEDNAGKFAASGYPGLIRRYANLLYETHKYEDALKYIDTVYQMNQGADPATNFTYAKLLIQAGRDSEAYSKLEEVVKAGKATPEMEASFRTLYLQQKGDSTQYENYMTDVKKVIVENMRRELAAKIMDKPAPEFTLQDVNGKSVSLSQYAGKTVILDFWATWCGPCKKSFPAMKKALNKYKNDPNVQFLFIHTWERDEKATEEAKAYVQDNHFDFEVLMDLKDPKTKKNKVVTSYGVNGIPAKFVIDPKGNIRFQLTGFNGSDEQAVTELSTMIEMARGTDKE